MKTVDEGHQLARQLFDRFLTHDFRPDNIFVILPAYQLQSMSKLLSPTKRSTESKKIMIDPEMSGVHMIIGLSNCSHMMPNRIAINRAYLEVAMEFGLYTVVLDPTISYGLKPSGRQIAGIIRDLAQNDGSDPIKGLEIFERFANYSRRYGKHRNIDLLLSVNSSE